MTWNGLRRSARSAHWGHGWGRRCLQQSVKSTAITGSAPMDLGRVGRPNQERRGLGLAVTCVYPAATRLRLAMPQPVRTDRRHRACFACNGFRLLHWYANNNGLSWASYTASDAGL